MHLVLDRPVRARASPVNRLWQLLVCEHTLERRQPCGVAQQPAQQRGREGESRVGARTPMLWNSSASLTSCLATPCQL